MRIRPAVLAAIAASLLATACAALFPTTPEAKFEESQKHYTQSVRWANYAVAQSFVEPEVRKEFRNRAAEFNGLRFADYRIQSVDMEPDGRSATAHVTYIGYRSASPVAVAYDEEQHWTYKSGGWLVRPQLAAERMAQPSEASLF
jgi:hypothetical protein